METLNEIEMQKQKETHNTSNTFFQKYPTVIIIKQKKIKKYIKI